VLTETDVAITVYYDDDENAALIRLRRELDELGVGYEECRSGDISADIHDFLSARSGGTVLFPSVVVNDDVLIQPSPAGVINALMRGQSSG